MQWFPEIFLIIGGELSALPTFCTARNIFYRPEMKNNKVDVQQENVFYTVPH